MRSMRCALLRACGTQLVRARPKAHREYATLLSIQQTLRYRGMSFLEFMRSGRMEIDG